MLSDAIGIHQQNVIMSLGASGSVSELSDQNHRVAKSQSLLDQLSGLEVHVGAPGSAGDKTGSADDKPGSASKKPGNTSNHYRAVWEKQHLLREHCWCSWKSKLLLIVQ